MERNYDEIIADMLIQIDVHSQELTKQSQELTRQSQRSDLLQSEQNKIHQDLVTQLSEIGKVNDNMLEQLVYSASLLDRIIKKNDLRL